ncbi:MAG: LemA family protein [Bacteroidota bacterium]
MTTEIPTQAQSGRKEIKPKTGCLGATLVIIILVILLIFFGIFAYISYNGLVSREVELKAKWTNVEALYQKRAALYTNIVDIVEASAKRESKTLIEVTQARSKATSVTLKADQLDNNKLNEFQQNQSGLESTFSRLLVANERYPDLKFPDQYFSLKEDIKAIETEIANAKLVFNDYAQKYNKLRRKFPYNIFGWMFGFEKAYNDMPIIGKEFEDKYSPDKKAQENKKLIKSED